MGLKERARVVKGDNSVCLQHGLRGLPGVLFALCALDHQLSLGVCESLEEDVVSTLSMQDGRDRKA